MQQRDANILRKIASEIDYLEAALGDMTAEQFNADETLKRAAAMAAINVGELAKHLSDQFHEEHPDNELRMAARTRDVYAHGYYSLSFERVYETARDDYPRVREWIDSALDAERPDEPTEIGTGA